METLFVFIFLCGFLIKEQFKQLLASPCRMVMSPPQPSHPSPPSSSLAQQIDREILELRNFFEDHREEMMSMLYDPQAQVRIQDLQCCGSGSGIRYLFDPWIRDG
jgi:hypothetical protein